MEKPEKKIWFPAKRYGWGWGLPCCWQGWVVMGIWLVITIGGTFALLPCRNSPPVLLLCFVFGMSLLLTAICWFKGETPQWRWGKK